MTDKDMRIHEFVECMQEGIGLIRSLQMADDLNAMNFFDAPASTIHHGNHPGGLFEHSLAVTESLVTLTDAIGLEWERPYSPCIVGMLHDLCKTDQYIRNEDGTYSYDKNLILPGHGEKSIILAQKIIQLTDEETACIRWHMGAFDDKENWNRYGAAIEQYNNVLFTHTADMMASRIIGI